MKDISTYWVVLGFAIIAIIIAVRVVCAEQVWCPPTYCSEQVACYGDCVCTYGHPWDYSGVCRLLREED